MTHLSHQLVFTKAHEQEDSNQLEANIAKARFPEREAE
jgi:hypothetical protein